jgi:hypothetical protein
MSQEPPLLDGANMKFLAPWACIATLTIFGAAQAADAAKPVVQVQMQTKVNPMGLALWDITNPAIGDDGNLDPKKISAAQWARLLEIGKALEEAGRTLATTGGVVAALPGAKLQDEGKAAAASKAADVQRFLDAKPAVFRTHALALQKTGASVVTAATRKDLKILSDVSNGLDEVCEKCHVIFWYPQLAKR